MVYLDYAASAPVDEEILKTYIDITRRYYANPNALHQLGSEAKKVIDEAARHTASFFHAGPDEIIYTSGATESNNLAVKGIAMRYRNRGKHILIGSLEHNSLTSSITSLSDAGFSCEILPLDQDGRIDLQELSAHLREDTILVSVCAVDSELGIVQPIEEIAQLLKGHRCFFHVDASQAIGKVDLNYDDVQLITFTPHKFGGINGSGALIKRKGVSLKSQIDGGKSTTIYRSGTPVPAEIAALDHALTKALNHQKERFAYVSALQQDLLQFLKNYPRVHINNTRYSSPYVINFSIPQLRAENFAGALENHQVYISTKTSCCPEHAPSKLVYALTHDRNLALSSMRISLSHLTNTQELDTFKEVFDRCYKELEQNG